MLDINKILNEPEKVKQAIINKGIKHIKPEDIDTLIELYSKQRELQLQIEKLREQRNKNAELLKTGNVAAEEKQDIIEEGKKLKEHIAVLESNLRDIKQKIFEIWQYVPNVPSEDTPIGEGEEDNKVVKTWGEPKIFNFNPKTHTELLEQAGLVDLKRGVKVAGFRGYFLLGDLARLHWAVLTYAFNKLIAKGFIPVIPPTLVHEWAMFGTGHFPWGKDDAYQVTKSGLTEDEQGSQLQKAPYLVGTAEVPLMGLFKDEILPEDTLPIKMVGFSPAYRKEVGAHSKDTKGLIRLHEFWKVEQVVLTVNNYEQANQLLEEITRNNEEIIEDLDLPYRRMAMCTGDMGEPQYKKFDIEVFMPGQNKYREIASHSIMGDFQARRNNIKYKTKEGKKEYVISLNGTAIPSPRILAIIAENYQNQDGSITIPEVLRPLMGGQERLHPTKLFKILGSK